MLNPDVAPTPNAERPAVVIVGDDADAVMATARSVAERTDVELPVVHSERDVADVLAGDRDVIVLTAGCVVEAQWLAGLQAAASSETTIATATPLVLTERDLGASDRAAFVEAARLIRTRSLGVAPRIRSCGGPCTYVRRKALALAGVRDVLTPPREEFARRCVQLGFSHVAADAVAVRASDGHGSETAIGLEPASREPLARALAAARRALRGLSVTIDGRCLAEPTTGTQVHVLELVDALARIGTRVRLLLPPELHPEAAELLARIPPSVERLHGDDAARSDVAHRPYQASPADVELLKRLGDRAVVTQQDLIGYANAAYFPDEAAWERQRAVTRAALAAADRVVFFSDYVAREAVAEGLVRPGEGRVVHLGTDRVVRTSTPPTRPPAVTGDDFVVCLGNDFAHKNRPFALLVCAELVRRHGWAGSLVFAGSRVAAGSSADDEAEVLAAQPELEGRVVDLGYVSDAESRWLLARAQLVLYPSVVEGFGLIPFEAARAGTPSAFAAQAALGETLPDKAALIVPWNAAATASRIADVLRSETLAQELVDLVLRAAEALTWEGTARSLVGVYEEAASAPARADEGAFAESPSLAMVEPLMSPDVQHAFAAVMLRPRTRRIVSGALLGAQSVGRSLGRLKFRR